MIIFTLHYPARKDGCKGVTHKLHIISMFEDYKFQNSVDHKKMGRRKQEKLII